MGEVRWAEGKRVFRSPSRPLTRAGKGCALGKAVFSTTSKCFSQQKKRRGVSCLSEQYYQPFLHVWSHHRRSVRTDKCKICMMHRLCIFFFHLHFFPPEDFCFALLPVENNSLCHGWLHFTLPFPSFAKMCL